MSRARLWKSKLFKISQFLLIFILIFLWLFSGFPRIWQNPSFPPEIAGTHLSTIFALDDSNSRAKIVIYD